MSTALGPTEKEHSNARARTFVDRGGGALRRAELARGQPGDRDPPRPREGNAFSGNRFSNNGDGLVISGDANTASGNRLSGPLECPGECGFGISLEGGTGNLIERNVVLGYHQAGIRAASFEEFGGPPTVGTTISRNVIRGPAVDGLLVESTAVDTLLERNVAIGAGADGIDVDNAATSLRGNVALRNDDLGIEAVVGVTDGGRNHAAANRNPAQCTNVAC